MPKFGKLYKKPYVVCVKIVLSDVLCAPFCSNLTGKHSYMGILMFATGRPNLIGKMLAAS
jgi:hypothetical protein